MKHDVLQINTNQSKSMNKPKYWIDLTMFSCKSTQIKTNIHVQSNLQDLKNLHLQINTNQKQIHVQTKLQELKKSSFTNQHKSKQSSLCKQSYQS
jgi:hypothetical protein